VPNVLDIDPLRAIAKRASARIGDAAIAKRYERLALDRLLKNPRNFRPAPDTELETAPEWARAAVARGETVSVVKPNSGAAGRVHRVARLIADACKVAASEQSAHPDDAAAIASARSFLAKFARADFDTVARRSLEFSRLLASWEDDLDANVSCPAQSLVLLGGRTWHRITSVADLRKVGREFRNCLARTTRAAAYGAMLAQGLAQFWVLRDLAGAGLIVAMAPAPEATHFTEVKGPRNALIPADHPDLTQLGIAIGVKPTPPTPPASPAFGVTPRGLVSLLELFDRPYPDPRDRRFALVRLRQRAGAP
jgi:hypothetical protein